LALVFTSVRTSLDESWLWFLQVQELDWMNLGFGFYKRKNFIE
jgi:hypothetical protein